MTWDRILRLIGPGLHWGRSRKSLLAALEKARQQGDEDAAGHIEIILELRDFINVPTEEDDIEDEKKLGARPSKSGDPP